MAAMTEFLCAPFSEDEQTVSYHGFKKSGQVFSCLHYCRFTEPKSKTPFFGKIHSVWYDKAEHEKMAEVAVFQFVPEERRCVQSDIYNELYSVHGDTMDIPLSCISPVEVSILHVPHTIRDTSILSYVDSNIGKDEYTDEESSDNGEEEDDDDMGDFIVNGDVFGWYRDCIDAKTDKIQPAPPPQFCDKFLSFETERDNKLGHEFVTYLRDEFVEPMMKDALFVPNYAHHAPHLFNALLKGEWKLSTEDTVLFSNGADNDNVVVSVVCTKFEKLCGFVHLLKTMLGCDPLPPLVELYTFCVGAQSVETNRKRSASEAALDMCDNNIEEEEWDSNEETSDDDDQYSVYSDED